MTPALTAFIFDQHQSCTNTAASISSVKKCLICLGLHYITNSKMISLQELFKNHQSKALRYSSHQILPFAV